MFHVLGSACVRALHVMMVRVQSELGFFLCAISTRAFDRLPPRHFYRGFVFVRVLYNFFSSNEYFRTNKCAKLKLKTEGN